MIKRQHREHHRRGLQSRRDARRRTGRKLLDLRNPVSRKIWRRAQPTLPHRPRVRDFVPRSPTAMLAAMAAIDEALR